MEGVRNISDNMIVFGKDEEEHDRGLENFENVLKRVTEVGLKLNKEKCKFRQTELVFFGHLVLIKELTYIPRKWKPFLKQEKHILNKKKSRSWDSLVSVRNSCPISHRLLNHCES